MHFLVNIKKNMKRVRRKDSVGKCGLMGKVMLWIRTLDSKQCSKTLLINLLKPSGNFTYRQV
jgi:hypothetical protein